jgi:hypothetical protein
LMRAVADDWHFLQPIYTKSQDVTFPRVDEEVKMLVGCDQNVSPQPRI